MKFEVKILRSAQRDFESIISYLINVLKSKQAAANFIDEFNNQIDLIKANPEIFGLSRMPELAEMGYRAFFINKYICLYKVETSKIIIAHIFHQTQDYAKYV